MQDDDGDWILVPPSNVTIFSVPGEPVILWDAHDKESAEKEALAYLGEV